MYNQEKRELQMILAAITNGNGRTWEILARIADAVETIAKRDNKPACTINGESITNKPLFTIHHRGDIQELLVTLKRNSIRFDKNTIIDNWFVDRVYNVLVSDYGDD